MQQTRKKRNLMTRKIWDYKLMSTIWIIFLSIAVVGLFGVGLWGHINKQAERAIYSRVSDLIVHSDQIAVIFADSQGVVSAISPGAEVLSGWDARELIGKPISVIMPPEVRARHSQILKDSHMNPGDVRIIKCNVQMSLTSSITLILHKYIRLGAPYYMVMIYKSSDVKEITP